MERWLHIDIELWLNHRVSGVLPVSIAASYWYAVLHYVVTPAVLVWLYGRDHRQYARTRNALIAATVIGLAVYLLFPTAPPRLMLGRTSTPSQRSRTTGGGAVTPPPQPDLESYTNELAAMPSLHIGRAVWLPGSCGATAKALTALQVWPIPSSPASSSWERGTTG